MLRMSLDTHVIEEDGELRQVDAIRDFVEELKHSPLHECCSDSWKEKKHFNNQLRYILLKKKTLESGQIIN